MWWFLLALLASVPAWANPYVVQCTAPVGCACTAVNMCQQNDGAVVPQNTYMNRIDIAPSDIGVKAFPPSGETFVADTGQQIY